MKRGWLALGGGLGLSALWRRRGRYRHGGEDAAAGDPAAELRAKLAQSRAVAASAVEEAPAVPVPDEALEPVAQPEESSPLDPEARRRSLHERARASMDELADDE